MGGDIVLSVKHEYDICQALVIVVVMTISLLLTYTSLEGCAIGSISVI